jgi:hypothetical protein
MGLDPSVELMVSVEFCVAGPSLIHAASGHNSRKAAARGRRHMLWIVLAESPWDSRCLRLADVPQRISGGSEFLSVLADQPRQRTKRRQEDLQRNWQSLFAGADRCRAHRVDNRINPYGGRVHAEEDIAADRHGSRWQQQIDLTKASTQRMSHNTCRERVAPQTKAMISKWRTTEEIAATRYGSRLWFRHRTKTMLPNTY